MRWLVPRVVVIAVMMVVVDRTWLNPLWLFFVGTVGILALALGSLTLLDRIVPMPPAKRGLPAVVTWALVALSVAVSHVVSAPVWAAVFACSMAALMVATRTNLPGRGATGR